MYINTANALYWGFGFMLVTIIVSFIVMALIEFPFTRLVQYTILPHISHDMLLK